MYHQIIKNKKVIYLVVFILFIFIALYFVQILNQKKESKLKSSLSQAMVSDYAVYKDYKFSSDKKVIDFGVQPLWLPVSLITSLMANDKILQAELSTLGYTLKTHQFLKGDDINHYILSGDLEAGVGGDMPTIRAVLNNDVKAVSVVQKGFVSLVAQDVLEIKDLKNKKIAYPYGSIAHYYLLNTLKKNKVDFSEVKLVPLDVIDIDKSINDGVIDAFTAWEPTATLALSKNPKLNIVHRGMSYGFLYVKEHLIKEAPEVVRVLLASQLRAVQWLKEDNDNLLIANKLISSSDENLFSEDSYLSLDQLSKIAKNDMTNIFRESFFALEDDLINKNGSIGQEFLFLQEMGLVDKKFKLEELQNGFDFSLIKSVIIQPEKYKLFSSSMTK